jgi:hypothetical protein
MLEVGICSPFQSRPKWFSDVKIWWVCWLTGYMLKFTVVLFKPLLKSSSCVNADTVVLENCFIVQICLDHGMHSITRPAC